MVVVILCGGKGTRMGGGVIKPLLPLGGVPVVVLVSYYYLAFGAHKVILCGGYKFDELVAAIKPWLLPSIIVKDTGQDTPTMQRILRVVDEVDVSSFHLTYSDGVSDVDIQSVDRFHCSSSADITVVGVPYQERFGIFATSANGKVVSFTEKPSDATRFINAGVYVMNTALLEELSHKHSFERDVLAEFARQERVSLYAHTGYWRCMDTRYEYCVLEQEVLHTLFWRRVEQYVRSKGLTGFHYWDNGVQGMVDNKHAHVSRSKG